MRTGSKEKARRWIAAHPDEWAFMQSSPADSFAGRLANGVRVFGSLTDAQLITLRTVMKQAAEDYAQARAARPRRGAELKRQA